MVIYDYGSEGKVLFFKMKEEIEKQVDFTINPVYRTIDENNLFQYLQLFKHVENDIILYK